MRFRSLNLKKNTSVDATKLKEKIKVLKELLQHLSQHTLPDTFVEKVNQEIDTLNALAPSNKNLLRTLSQKTKTIVHYAVKDLKRPTINYYKNLWIPLGMSVFGLPIGMAIALSVKNLGLLAVGLPVGLGIGALLGTHLDNKAKKEGRQLPIEIK